MKKLLMLLLIIPTTVYLMINIYTFVNLDATPDMVITTLEQQGDIVKLNYVGNNISHMCFILEYDNGETITQTEIGTFVMHKEFEVTSFDYFNVFGSLVGRIEHSGVLELSFGNGYFAYVKAQSALNEEHNYASGQPTTEYLNIKDFNIVIPTYDNVDKQINKHLFVLGHGYHKTNNDTFTIYLQFA